MSTPNAGETKGKEVTQRGHRLQNRLIAWWCKHLRSLEKGPPNAERNPYLDAGVASKMCNEVVSGRIESEKRNQLCFFWGDTGRNKRCFSQPSSSTLTELHRESLQQCSSWNPSPRFTIIAEWIWSSHSALVKLRLPVFINHLYFFKFPIISNLHSS